MSVKERGEEGARYRNQGACYQEVSDDTEVELVTPDERSEVRGS